jgi:hypothetical protein
MRFLKVLIVLCLFFFGLLFFTQNKEILSTMLLLKIDLFYPGYKWSGFEVPFYFVVLIGFAVGMLFASLFFAMDKLRLVCSVAAKKRSIRVLEREVKRLNAEKLAIEAKAVEAKAVAAKVVEAEKLDKKE